MRHTRAVPAPDSVRVVVYRTSSCPFCVAAVRLLTAKGIAFREESLDRHPDRWSATAAIKPGHSTVPLIVIDGEPLGGFEELVELEARGGLDQLA